MTLPIKAFRSSPYTLTNTTEENPPIERSQSSFLHSIKRVHIEWIVTV